MGTHFRGAPRETLALDAYIKLTRAAESLTASLAPGLAAQGLTTSQLGVLEALWHLGPLCQRELGDKLLRSSSNVTTVIDNLERRGLVTRQRTGEDRRVITIRLTDAGRRTIQKAFPPHLRDIVAAFAHLSAADQRELARLCRALGRGLAAQPAIPGPSAGARRRRRDPHPHREVKSR
jgi:MarR family transcriptional regulator, 2-MHQ and catechol-resistance regulon repressor